MRSLASGLLAIIGLALCNCMGPIYLKKYVAVVPQSPGSMLAGRTVYVEPFTDQHDVEEDWDETESLEDPPGYTYRELDDDVLERWEYERSQLEDLIPESQHHKVGWQRNMIGMRIRDVMSVNPPTEWLTESARVELQAQGATLVDSPDAAEIVVRGSLRHLVVDLFMATWCNVVVDFTIEPRSGQPLSTRIHTAGAQSTAWSGGSEQESYEVLRRCEQKLNYYLMSEIHRALGGGVDPVPSSAPTS